MNKEQKNTKWYKTAKILLSASLILDIVIIVNVILLFGSVGIKNVLGNQSIYGIPVRSLFICIVAILLLLTACILKLLFAKKKKKQQDYKARNTKRGIGCALVALLLVICIVTLYILIGLSSFWNNLSKDTVMNGSMVVYVLRDKSDEVVRNIEVSDEDADSSEEEGSHDLDGDGYVKHRLTVDGKCYSLDVKEDLLKDYSYGYAETGVETWDNDTVFDDLEEKFGRVVKDEQYEYESWADEMAALYSGEVDAIVVQKDVVDGDLSNADEGELDEFQDYEDKVVPVFCYMIEGKYEAQKMEANVTEEAFVLYISGSDTRSDKLVASQSRSDVNILAVINPKSHQVLLLSTPRDYYVEIQRTDKMKDKGFVHDKLTHCGLYWSEGVPRCSMDTLGHLYGIDVDGFAQVNFNGFETLIDDIGGVTVYSEKTTRTREGGYQIYEGDNEMSGKVALAFCRDRYNFAGGDNARGVHQMAVVQAILKKMTSSTTLLSSWQSILDDLSDMMLTNMDTADIKALIGQQLNDASEWNIKTFAVTGTGGSEKTYSMPSQRAYVMYQNEASVNYAKELIQKVKNGENLTDEQMKMPESTTAQ